MCGDTSVTPGAHDAHMGERVGVAVVRVWVEPDGGFRGRITTTVDVGERDEEITAAGAPEDVLRALSDWMEAVTRR